MHLDLVVEFFFARRQPLLLFFKAPDAGVQVFQRPRRASLCRLGSGNLGILPRDLGLGVVSHPRQLRQLLFGRLQLRLHLGGAIVLAFVLTEQLLQLGGQALLLLGGLLGALI